MPCPGGCSNGQCSGDPCAGVVCSSPPAGCYEATGKCHNGLCQYDVDTGASCNDDHACTTGDVCAAGRTCDGTAVVCATPPAVSCKDANTLVVSAANGTCGGGTCTHIVDELKVQGGAKVTCATDDLRIHARSIFIDPASSIDLSGTSIEASGGRYGFCSDGQLNQAATGGAGGGNGTAGQTAAVVEWQYEVRYCSGGPQCHDELCAACTGGLGWHATR